MPCSGTAAVKGIHVLARVREGDGLDLAPRSRGPHEAGEALILQGPLHRAHPGRLFLDVPLGTS
ncbi:hypothetical protein ACU4GA_02385 [Methylobacterium oryzae CBMB20]